MFLTTGAQQGLYLLTKILVSASDSYALTDAALYPAFRQVVGINHTECVRLLYEKNREIDLPAMESVLAAIHFR